MFQYNMMISVRLFSKFNPWLCWELTGFLLMRSQVIDNKEFHSLILEDASSVQGRQETDSIPVVDDVRFHLYKVVLPINGVLDDDDEIVVDGESRLQMLETLLQNLGVEC